MVFGLLEYNGNCLVKLISSSGGSYCFSDSVGSFAAEICACFSFDLVVAFGVVAAFVTGAASCNQGFERSVDRSIDISSGFSVSWLYERSLLTSAGDF